MKSHFTYLIEPTCLKGAQAEFGIHPEAKSRMYFTTDGFNCRIDGKRILRGVLKINLIKMDSLTALIQYDCSVVGEDWLFVKRDGKWIKVLKYMNWIS